MRAKDLPGIFIFLLPPSWAELKRRLTRRQTEGQKALKERLRMAKVEMGEARWYDYVIINDEIKKAEEQLQAIILSEHCRRERMAEALEEMLQGK
jgi:guanylate kinase